VQCKQVSVANVLNQNPLNITFGHRLTKSRWRLRLQLVYRLMLVQANNEKDIFVWGFTSSRAFQSMYLDLLVDDTK
jgi:hypothetical protein